MPIPPDPRTWLALAGLLLIASPAAAPAAPTLRTLAIAEDERRFRPELEEGLRAKDGALRARAALAVGRLQDTTTVAALFPLLDDASPEVRREAVFALGQIGHRSARSALEARLADTDPETALLAVEALGKLGDKAATPRVVAALASRSGAHRAAAAMALWRLADSTALDPLLGRHDDPDPEVRWRVIYALEKIVAADRVVPTIAGHLDDPSPLVRSYVARTLGRQKSPRSIAYLLQALSDREVPVRVNAIRALQFIGDTSCVRCGTALVGMLHDPHPYVRSTATAALGERFARAPADSAARRTLVDSLTARLGDPDAATRTGAARSLMAVQGAASAAIRRLMLDDPSLDVRTGVMDGIRRLPPSPAWLDFLRLRMAPDHPLFERMTAADVIGARAEPGSARALRGALPDTSVLFVASVVSALAAVKDSASLPLLAQSYAEHLGDGDPDARIAIYDALRDLAGAAYADSVERAHPRPSPPPAGYPAEFETPPRTRGAVLHTEKGDVTWAFDGREAPQTVRNFVRLAKRGYFDGRTFHRVVPNFVVQDGDPTGTGSGGPGYTIRCEYNRLRYAPGMVGMALSGKDTGGSQWFITHSPQPHLDGKYTIFAHVTKGLDVVQTLVQGDHIDRVEILE